MPIVPEAYDQFQLPAPKLAKEGDEDGQDDEAAGVVL